MQASSRGCVVVGVLHRVSGICDYRLDIPGSETTATSNSPNPEATSRILKLALKHVSPCSLTVL